MRAQFLEYAKTSLDKYQIILAENIAREIKENQVTEWEDIATFENQLSKLAGCVIIFPESPGSFAELGYFSNSPEVNQKTLVVNCLSKQKDSFITIGPVNLIDKKSKFQTTIYTVRQENSWNFDNVKMRIEDRLDRTKRFHMPFLYKDASFKEQMFLTLKTIRIFPLLDRSNLIKVMSELFGNGPYYENLPYHLATLSSCNYIRITERGLFFPNLEIDELLEIDSLDEEKARLEILEFYQSHQDDKYEEWTRLNDT